MAMKNKEIEVLGIWEEIYNPIFNSLKFEGINNQAGLNRFVLSVKPIAKQAVSQLTQIPRMTQLSGVEELQ